MIRKAPAETPDIFPESDPARGGGDEGGGGVRLHEKAGAHRCVR